MTTKPIERDARPPRGGEGRRRFLKSAAGFAIAFTVKLIRRVSEKGRRR